MLLRGDFGGRRTLLSSSSKTSRKGFREMGRLLKTGLIGDGTVLKDTGDVARLRNGLFEDKFGVGSRVRLREGLRSKGMI